MDPIKAKIVEAVPEITKCPACGGQGWTAEHDSSGSHDPETGECQSCPVQVQCERCNLTGEVEPRPITLADVLLAYCKQYSAWLATKWEEGERISRHEANILMLVARFDKTTDYDGQYPETKAFIGSLLGV